MATLSTCPSNPASNPNSDANLLFPDNPTSSSSMSTQSGQRFYDSSATPFSSDYDTVVSEGLTISTNDVGSALIGDFSPRSQRSLNFVTSLTPPPPIRTSRKHSPALSPNSPNSTLTLGSNSHTPALLHVSFNQDSGCFATGTDRGFRIYNCDPFCEIFRRDFDRGGGIGNVEMLFRCNILALIGGGPEPKFPTNKVMIWDDHLSRCIGELSFRSKVYGIRLRRDLIVVVLEQKVLVHNFADMKLLYQVETIPNPKGLCEVSQIANMVLACPGLHKGEVRIEHFSPKRTRFVVAHDSGIARLALTQDGALLATASNKGTLVRVFNTEDGSILQEVRRGADRAEIYCLSFSPDADWLAVSSDKGTVHVFGLNTKKSGSSSGDSLHGETEGGTLTSPSSSSFSFMKAVLPKYFSSERSVAQFHLVESCPYVVAFGHQRNTVVMLGLDGSFYKCQFDPVQGGEMTQLEYHTFLKPDGPS